MDSSWSDVISHYVLERLDTIMIDSMKFLTILFLSLHFHDFKCTALVLRSCGPRGPNTIQTSTQPRQLDPWTRHAETHRPATLLRKTQLYSNAFDIDSKDVLPNGEYSRILITEKRRVEKRFLRQRLANRLLNRLNRNTTNTKDDYDEDEDGYSSMMKPYRPLLEQLLRIPWKMVRKIAFPDIAKEPGTLILVRHGESLWNFNKTFTGWADPDLSERGYREVEHAARYMDRILTFYHSFFSWKGGS